MTACCIAGIAEPPRTVGVSRWPSGSRRFGLWGGESSTGPQGGSLGRQYVWRAGSGLWSVRRVGPWRSRLAGAGLSGDGSQAAEAGESVPG